VEIQHQKRVLFLADRNILVDQTKNNDFKPFGAAMSKISKRQIDNNYEMYPPCFMLSPAVRKSRISTSSSHRISLMVLRDSPVRLAISLIGICSRRSTV